MVISGYAIPITIPSKIRRRHRIVLQSLAIEYFEKMAGILKTKGKLTRTILPDRSWSTEGEDKGKRT